MMNNPEIKFCLSRGTTGMATRQDDLSKKQCKLQVVEENFKKHLKVDIVQYILL